MEARRLRAHACWVHANALIAAARELDDACRRHPLKVEAVHDLVNAVCDRVAMLKEVLTNILVAVEERSKEDSLRCAEIWTDL